MGCHTWYKKPLIRGKENIKKYYLDEINLMREKSWWNDDCEIEALLKLEFLNNADENTDFNESDFEFETIYYVNGEHVLYVKANGYDTDEPRIGGYPLTVIRSADEMFKVMETGLVNWEGVHYNFYWDHNRDEQIRNNIIEFFNEYPDGIIEFG